MTPDALHEALTALRAGDVPWDSPTGRAVLAEAHERYAGIAIAYGLDPADAVQHAWLFWQHELTDDRLTDIQRLWSYTAKSLRNSLAREAAAAEKLTSVTAARRRDTKAATRHRGDVADLADLPAEAPEPPEAQRSPDAGVIGHVLAIAGLTPAQQDVVVDTISTQAWTARTLSSASDSLSRGIPAALHHSAMTPARWRSIVSLLIGTPKGAPGIIKLVGDGHPAPLAEPHINRLMSQLSAA